MKASLKKTIRITSAILSSALVITTVSGCSLFQKNQNETKVRNDLVVWGFENEDIWKPVFQDLSDDLKGYNVVYVKKTLNENYENDSLNSIMSDQGPDVWAIPSDWVYRHKDKLVPIPSAPAKGTKLKDFYSPIVNDLTLYDDNYYGLTPAVDPLILYYNNRIFETISEQYGEMVSTGKLDGDEGQRLQKILADPPNTWNQLLELNKLVTAKSGATITRSGIALGTANNVAYSTDILYALMLQNETSMTSDKDNIATFNLPQTDSAGKEVVLGKKALEFYNDFSNPNSANYSWNSSMPNSVEAFMQGKTSMIIGFKSLESYFKQTSPDFEYQTAPLPQVIGADDTKVVDYARFTTFAIPKLSPHQDLAYKIINQLASRDRYATAKNLLFSGKEDESFKPSLTERAGSGITNAIVQTAKNWNKKRYPKEIDAIMKNVIEVSSTGKLSPQAALDNAATSVTALLRKTQW